MSDDDDWDVDDDWEPPAVVAPVGGAAKTFDDEEEEEEEGVDPNSKYAGMTLLDLVKELEKRDKQKNDLSLGKLKAKRRAIKEAEELERVARQKAAEEAAKEQTPEEMWARKKMEQDRIEAADMELAAEFIGDNGGIADGAGETGANKAVPKKAAMEAVEVVLIEAMDPKSLESFHTMAAAITRKANKYKKSPHYVPGFLKALAQGLCEDLTPENTKKWAGFINVITNDKNKAIKGKVKPKSKRAQLGGTGKGQGGADRYENEYDDFM